MPTIKELLDTIHAEYTAHAPSDDSRYSAPLAKFYLDYFTAFRITERRRRTETTVRGNTQLRYDPALYQDYKLTISDGVATLPDVPIDAAYDNGIHQVYTVNRFGIRQGVEEIPPGGVQMWAAEPWGQRAYARLGQTLNFYGTGVDVIKHIWVTMIGSKFNADSLDVEYPLPSDLVMQVVQDVSNRMLGVAERPQDTSNDGIDQVRPQQ